MHIHQPSAGTQGQITDMAIHMKRLETIKARMNRILAENTGKSVEEVEKEFEGKGYGDFKVAVGEVTADTLTPIQDEFKRLMADKAYLEGVMKSGAERAYRTARKTMSKVYRKIGFVQI